VSRPRHDVVETVTPSLRLRHQRETIRLGREVLPAQPHRCAAFHAPFLYRPPSRERHGIRTHTTASPSLPASAEQPMADDASASSMVRRHIAYARDHIPARATTDIIQFTD
jgi:hypothetical protein